MSEWGVLLTLRSELEKELTQGILPYWMTRAVDDVRGGFVGLLDADGRADPQVPKGAILKARILWTFEASQRALALREYVGSAVGSRC